MFWSDKQTMIGRCNLEKERGGENRLNTAQKGEAHILTASLKPTLSIRSLSVVNHPKIKLICTATLAVVSVKSQLHHNFSSTRTCVSTITWIEELTRRPLTLYCFQTHANSSKVGRCVGKFELYREISHAASESVWRSNVDPT